MQSEIDLRDSVVAPMAYVDDAGWTEQAELVAQLMMSSVHPDVESSVATAAFLPCSVRVNVAGFLSAILLGEISDEQRYAIISSTQRWTLASLGQ